MNIHEGKGLKDRSLALHGNLQLLHRQGLKITSFTWELKNDNMDQF